VAASLVVATQVTDHEGAGPRPARRMASVTVPSATPPPSLTTSLSPATSVETQAGVATVAPLAGATEPRPGEPMPPPTLGALRIGAVPQSQIWVDGRLLGWSPLTLRAQAGTHTVSIGRDDHEEPSTRRVVTVTPGHFQRVGF
jgi:hypothetical protein